MIVNICQDQVGTVHTSQGLEPATQLADQMDSASGDVCSIVDEYIVAAAAHLKFARRELQTKNIRNHGQPH